MKAAKAGLRVPGVRLAERRSGRGAAPTAARGTRSSRSGRAGGGRRRRPRAIATRCRDRGARARGATPTSRRRQAARIPTGIGEFDRVLGGGIVPGSLVLLGGEPGIGKSTLLLQAAAIFAQTVGTVLYASGEESEHQIKSRGDRLGVGDAPLFLLAETCIESILEEIGRVRPRLLIVDSVQTVFSLKFQSAPGSIGQVREAATQFLFTAKGHNIPDVPGRPRHEGRQHRRTQGARARRRHGALFRRRAAPFASRRARGQEPVWRDQRAGRVRDDRAAASSRCRIRRRCFSPSGPRPRQARRCCARSRVRGRSSSRCRRSPARRRTAWPSGWRSASIRTGCRCCWRCSRSAPACTWSSDDVFVNIAGGMSIDEPAADLAIVSAVASSVRNRPLVEPTAVFGEVGLGGEVRGVPQADACACAKPSRWASRASSCRPPTSTASSRPATRHGARRARRRAPRRRGARRPA